MSNGKRLCGNPYDPEKRCEHLRYVCKPGERFGKKELRIYHLYCMAEGRCRSLGCIASNTGNSPMWCPKRKERNDETTDF